MQGRKNLVGSLRESWFILLPKIAEPGAEKPFRPKKKKFLTELKSKVVMATPSGVDAALGRLNLVGQDSSVGTPCLPLCVSCACKWARAAA